VRQKSEPLKFFAVISEVDANSFVLVKLWRQTIKKLHRYFRECGDNRHCGTKVFQRRAAAGSTGSLPPV